MNDLEWYDVEPEFDEEPEACVLYREICGGGRRFLDDEDECGNVGLLSDWQLD
jgi:hypothetical protein